jgi:hypothetical protein
MDFLVDIVRCGLLPLPEILRRYQAGEISETVFLRALCGRVAQEAADDLPDGNATRDRLLDFASDTEDWFQARFSRELL